MADDADALAPEAPETPDYRIIIAELAVTRERDEIGDQGRNIIEAVRPIRVAGHLGFLPGGEIGIELHELLCCLGLQPGNLLADGGCAVAGLERAQLVDLGLDFG